MKPLCWSTASSSHWISIRLASWINTDMLGPERGSGAHLVNEIETLDGHFIPGDDSSPLKQRKQ